tara:strand:- start:283 stop:429 length:147 start_codon:yes stop_codon:yes gene_type:complete
MSPKDAPMNPAKKGLIGKAMKWTIGIKADTKIIMKEIETDNIILLLEY